MFPLNFGFLIFEFQEEWQKHKRQKTCPRFLSFVSIPIPEIRTEHWKGGRLNMADYFIKSLCFRHLSSEGGRPLNDSVENMFFRLLSSEGKRWNMRWISLSHVVLLVPVFHNRKVERGVWRVECGNDRFGVEHVFLIIEGSYEGRNNHYSGF